VLFTVTGNVAGSIVAAMKLIRSVREMQEAGFAVKRSGRRVALVPTMGALHEGHAVLMRQARELNAAVAVSIYVNPTQFAPNEDFKKYPRDLDADCALCIRESVDVVFAPGDAELYPDGAPGLQASTWVEEATLSKRLEGERRPGHFRGVCTVVEKLLNIVRPDLAVFGQKDYQQFRVIERMVRDLCHPVKLVCVPTARDPDGLAMSSRNQYLSSEERMQATVLWKSLKVAQELFKTGEVNAHRLESAVMRGVQMAPAARLDYAAIADAETLEPVTEVKRGHVALIAAHVGKTRLIDNLIL
jgi:pantoate--beta-alanine ligase